MKLRFLAILVLMIFLVGCQKYGLSIKIPKEYEETKEVEAEKEMLEKGDIFAQVPTTRAVIMKDGRFDLTTVVPKELSLEFSQFRIQLIPDETNSYFKVMIFQPKDYHNDYTINFLLNPEGKVLAQAIIQKENGLVTAGDELILRR